MARNKREFVESGEIRAVAENLKMKYPELLLDANLNDVYFAFCITERAKNSQAAVIRKNVTDPLVGSQCRYPYQIAIYRDDWDEWIPAIRHLRVLEALMYIGEEGKYKKPDVQELYPLVATFGPDWRDDPTIPDVLASKIEMKQREEEMGEEEEAKQMDPIVLDIVNEKRKEREAIEQKAAKAEMYNNDHPQEDEPQSSTDF